MQERVSLDKEEIGRLAQLLKKANLPEPTELPTECELNPTRLLNAYFNLIVPICHQTTPIGGVMLEGDVDGKHRVGWDYLSQKLLKEVKSDPSILNPEIFRYINGGDLKAIFSESSWQNHDFHQQSMLLRQLGRWMYNCGFENAESLFDYCKRQIRNNTGPGIIDKVKQTEVYSDPAEKKIRFALSLIQTGGLYKFKDPENLGPIVDYHETRLHLRLGTVVVNDKDLESALREFKPVKSEDDVAIRMNVGLAIEELGRQTGFTVNQLHWYLWNAARNSCKRKGPFCNDDKGQEARPTEYRAASLFKEIDSGCEFKEICSSLGEVNPLNDTFVPDGHFH